MSIVKVAAYQSSGYSEVRWFRVLWAVMKGLARAALRVVVLSPIIGT